MGLFSKMVCLLKDHTWSEWTYAAQSSCSQQRQCLRCGIVEQGNHTAHVWETAGCTQTCQRCKIQGDAHDWDEWRGGVRKCKGCGTEEVCEHHWVPDACGYDYCPNCGDVTYTSVMG